VPLMFQRSRGNSTSTTVSNCGYELTLLTSRWMRSAGRLRRPGPGLRAPVLGSYGLQAKACNHGCPTLQPHKWTEQTPP